MSCWHPSATGKYAHRVFVWPYISLPVALNKDHISFVHLTSTKGEGEGSALLLLTNTPRVRICSHTDHT